MFALPTSCSEQILFCVYWALHQMWHTIILVIAGPYPWNPQALTISTKHVYIGYHMTKEHDLIFTKNENIYPHTHFGVSESMETCQTRSISPPENVLSHLHITNRPPIQFFSLFAFSPEIFRIYIHKERERKFFFFLFFKPSSCFHWFLTRNNMHGLC